MSFSPLKQTLTYLVGCQAFEGHCHRRPKPVPQVTFGFWPGSICRSRGSAPADSPEEGHQEPSRKLKISVLDPELRTAAIACHRKSPPSGDDLVLVMINDYLADITQTRGHVQLRL